MKLKPFWTFKTPTEETPSETKPTEPAQQDTNPKEPDELDKLLDEKLPEESEEETE